MLGYDISGRFSVFAVAIFAAFLGAALAACSNEPEQAVQTGAAGIGAGDLQSLDQRGAYVAAYELGRNLAEQGVRADVRLLAQGIRDGFNGARPLLTDAEMHRAMLEFGNELERRQQERAVATDERNRSEGEAFLRSNRQRPGVTELPSGLQYEVLQEGTGPRPSPSDRVTVHYEGRLLDGTVFNTSEGMGRAMSFTVDEVIPGWREALLMMHEGARWRIWLPPELAFGERSPGPLVGANATVVFDIELLSVE